MLKMLLSMYLISTLILTNNQLTLTNILHKYNHTEETVAQNVMQYSLFLKSVFLRDYPFMCILIRITF